jgi:hypothetical protein
MASVASVRDRKGHRRQTRRVALALRPRIGAWLGHYRLVFLTRRTSRAPYAHRHQGVDPALKERLLEEQAAPRSARQAPRRARAAERTAAPVHPGAGDQPRVDRTRRGSARSTSPTLITKTLELLRGDGEWVLYKLDRGIDQC